jgi:hypothetical protein
MRTKRSSSFVVVVSAASVLWFLASIGNFSTAQELPKNDQTGSTLSREAWRKIMVRTPHPKPQGCFVATHPKIEWREVQCTKAPEKPYPPVPWPRPNVVGNGSDFSAQVTGSLSSAEGSFDLVSGVTSETGNGGAANNYSLQVNSNTFTTTTCNGATNPAVCRGWQQFVYSNGGFAFMQYWLLNYGTCQAGWNTYGSHCWKNGTAVGVPVQPLSNLPNLTVTGTATNGGTDTIAMSTGSNVYSASGNDNVVNLSAGWQIAEYNIFGDCCGSQANFNTGSFIHVRTSVNNGTINAPTVTTQGFTGETNNFTLVPPACPYGGASPALVFDESTNTNPSAICANGTVIGDTHITNVNGLLYDFQATGDFLTAETDPDFVVQTRQVSGAPTWPNASVNKAVALRMGNTRLAICLAPNRFIVNGKPEDLADGSSISLPGAIVSRHGDSYVFTRPNSESVRADLNGAGVSSWINVSLDLGHSPIAWVHGLLGNVNGNTEPNELATRTGVVLHQPVAFMELYNHYGNSWRVPPEESLLTQLCGDRDVERGNPAKAFYANDLTPQQQKRARELCTAAGVKEGALLEACMLDVTVLENKTAADAFTHVTPPRAVVRPSTGKCDCDEEKREEQEERR